MSDEKRGDNTDAVIADLKITHSERSLGSQMSEADLAKMFGEPPPQPKPQIKLPKTEEEMEKFEEKLEGATGIYKIAARVKNLARSGGGSLMPAGEMLCNSYVHVLKALYDFADTLPEPHYTNLTNLIRQNENFPAQVIASANAGVKRQK